MLNLWQWADEVGDEGAAAAMADVARSRLLAADCPVEAELVDADNFFPACLMRALALTRVLPAEEIADFLAALPDDFPLEPVTDIRSPHEAGLNFSRPWGLWALYEATGDPRWRDLWLDHVAWQLAHPEYWAEDYASYAHWVPQFGVYALDMIE